MIKGDTEEHLSVYNAGEMAYILDTELSMVRKYARILEDAGYTIVTSIIS